MRGIRAWIKETDYPWLDRPGALPVYPDRDVLNYMERQNKGPFTQVMIRVTFSYNMLYVTLDSDLSRQMVVSKIPLVRKVSEDAWTFGMVLMHGDASSIPTPFHWNQYMKLLNLNQGHTACLLNIACIIHRIIEPQMKCSHKICCR